MAAEHLSHALRDGGVQPLDERGLMPLADARALVSASDEFVRGERAPDRADLAGDRLWAALLSLADGGEFVREASRLRWVDHPRGAHNIDPYLRYGDAIVPWLATFLHGGRLSNVPWCVVPCLLECGTDAAFELAWATRAVVPVPVEVSRSAPPEAAVHPDADRLIVDWVMRHGPETLAAHAIAGDVRAQRLLRAVAREEPSQTFERTAARLSHAAAAHAFARSDAPRQLDVDGVLATLDDACSSGHWPEFERDEPEEAYFALRMSVVRAREGDGWGVLFERLQGSSEDDAQLRLFAIGNRVPAAGRVVDFRAVGFFLTDDEATGPRGSLALSGALQPDRMTAPFVRDPRFTLALRLYLEHHPDAFWLHPIEVCRALGLPDDSEILVACRELQVPGETPSASPVFQSVARVLVERNPSAFVAGEPNTDWRRYARHEVET